MKVIGSKTYISIRRLTKIANTQKTFVESDHKGFPGDNALNVSSERDLSKFSPGGDRGNGQDADMDSNANKIMVDKERRITSQIAVDNFSDEELNGSSLNSSGSSHSGAFWDVFRGQDMPMLIKYLRFHWKKHGDLDHLTDDSIVLLTPDYTFELLSPLKTYALADPMASLFDTFFNMKSI
ncbi:hypothetical protein FXO38_28830, partial [Capsicum annuum]